MTTVKFIQIIKSEIARCQAELDAASDLSHEEVIRLRERVAVLSEVLRLAASLSSLPEDGYESIMQLYEE